MKNRRRTLPQRRAGFTLTELLAVLAVMGIVMAFSVPHLAPLLGAASLKKDGSTLVSSLGEARQLAMSLSTDVEVRLYENPNVNNASSKNYIGYQTFRFPPDGAQNDDPSGMVPVQRRINFSDGIMVNTQLSSIVNFAGLATNDRRNRESGRVGPTQDTVDLELVAGAPQPVTYVAFRFTSNGGTNFAVDSNVQDTYHITLVSDEASAVAPAAQLRDFFTVQINPLNGSLQVFEPLP